MNQIKEGAKEVRTNMTFIQEFLQKKYGFGILIFVIILGGFVTAVAFFNKGVENGEKSSKDEVVSLKSNRKSDSLEIKYLNNRVYYYKKALDTCNSNSMNSNLEQLVTKKLEEAERIKRILERKIVSDQKDINTIYKLIK